MHIICSTYFYKFPRNPSSHHIEDRIDALRDLGVTVDVLSGPIPADPESVSLQKLVQRRVGSSFLRRLLMATMLPFVIWESIFVFIENKLPILWLVFGSLRFLRKIRRDTVIYSSGGSLSGHVFGFLLATLTRRPWVAEIQDPIRMEMAHVRGHRLVETLIYKRADLVIFLTESALKFACKSGLSVNRAAAIYPGARVLAAPQISRHDKNPPMILGHFGSFYRSRNPALLIQSIIQLQTARLIPEGAIEVRGYGYTNASAEDLSAWTGSGIFKQQGPQDRLQTQKAMGLCDFLLLVQHLEPVSSLTIPSKVYEYLNTGLPILALVYKNEELKSMLEDLGHLVASADSQSEISDCLQRAREIWRSNSVALAPVNPYSTEGAATQLIEEIRRRKLSS